MGLEALQNLPTDNSTSRLNVVVNTIGVLLGITFMACWAATEYAAYKLACQPALGTPIVTWGWFKLYSPFDFFVWMIEYGHVQGTESAFNGGEWIIFSLHFLVIPAIWLSMRQYKKINAKSDLHGSAHWATPKEVRRTGLLDKAGGCYVGAWPNPETKRQQYLTQNGPEHIIALAPTRSGKGVGLVLPTMLSWRESVVMFDIKGEGWNLTSGWRRQIGQRVLKFEPANPDGSSVCFNPLEEIRLRTDYEVSDAQNLAQIIVDPDGKGLDDHWAKTGHDLLTGAILHIMYVYPVKTLAGLVNFFCDPERTMDQVAEAMLNTEHDPTGARGWIDMATGLPTKTNPDVAKSARSFLNKAENEKSGVQSTALSFLGVYRDPIIARNTAVSEFRIDDLMNNEKPVSLYIVITPNDMARLRPLLRLLINQIIRLSTKKMSFKNGRSVAGYKHRLLMMLDEFPTLKKLDQVEQALAFAAGYGIKFYLIVQDLSQLYAAYGQYESITGNCHVCISYATNNKLTSEWISKLCGVMTIHRTVMNVSGNRLNPVKMHAMESVQETQRPLILPDEVRRLPGPIKEGADGTGSIKEAGDMLVIVSGASPIYGKQILYFKDPTFSRRSLVPPPDTSDRIYDRTEDKKNIPIPPAQPPASENPASETDANREEYTEEQIAAMNAEAEDNDEGMAEDIEAFEVVSQGNEAKSDD